MRPHRHPHKRYNVYLPVETYEAIAVLAVRHERMISGEIAVALESYRQQQFGVQEGELNAGQEEPAR